MSAVKATQRSIVTVVDKVGKGTSVWLWLPSVSVLCILSKNGKKRRQKRVRQAWLRLYLPSSSLLRRKSQEGQPSLRSKVGAGPPAAGRQRGVKPRKQEPLALGTVCARAGKVVKF